MQTQQESKYHEGVYSKFSPEEIANHIPQYNVVPYSKGKQPKPLSAAQITQTRDKNILPRFLMMKSSIWSAVGTIYTKEEAEEELQRKDVDVEQEYLNQYTTGRDSIFGKVTEEDEDENVDEWQ